MKSKLIKSLAIGAAAIPCALMLTACGGDGQVKVDTKGAYQDTTFAEASTYFDTVDEAGNFEFGGLKFTSKMFLDMSTSGMQMSVDTTMNGIVTYADEILAKCDMSATAKVSIQGKTEKQTEKGSVYVKDDYLYIKVGSEKTKVAFSDSSQGDVSNTIPTSGAVTGLLNTISQQSDIKCQVATKENVVKYSMTGSVAAMGDIEFYLVFENDQLSAFQLNVENKDQETGKTIYKLTMNAERTTETVTITENLDSYIDVNNVA